MIGAIKICRKIFELDSSELDSGATEPVSVDDEAMLDQDSTSTVVSTEWYSSIILDSSATAG